MGKRRSHRFTKCPKCKCIIMDVFGTLYLVDFFFCIHDLEFLHLKHQITFLGCENSRGN